MKGHKTNGDWSDVTSFGRNEIVFEHRNKEYGAFAVRKRYTGALLLGLLVSVSVGVITAGVPLVINMFGHHEEVVDKGPIVNATPTIIVENFNHKQKKEEKKVQPIKKTPQTRNTPPLVVKDKERHDSVPPVNDLNNHNVGTQTIAGKPDDTQQTVQKTNPGNDTKGTDEIFKIAQIMPKFKDGDLYGYIEKHLNYPTIESEAHIEGTSFVQFVVEADGAISNVKVVRGVAGGPGLDEEAARVIRELPKWEPGQQNGHAVRVQYTIPIKFQLR